jgi:hypothetical protein
MQNEKLRRAGLIVLSFCILHFAFCISGVAATLDAFDDISRWKAVPADGVEMKLSQDEGHRGPGLRIDFDFHGHGGYAIARREGKLDLPPNFELSFWMHAEAPRNTLELKLIDETGENVWWHTKRELDFPSEWKRITVRKSQIDFAWGPKGPGPVPERIGALEIVITAGMGGQGTVWIDDLTLNPIESTTELPPPYGPFHDKVVTIDMKQRRAFGGMTLDWDKPVDYTIEISNDGNDWEAVRRVKSNGGRDWIETPDADARYIRILPGDAATLMKLALQPTSFSKTPNDFFAAIAAGSKRGDWPRYLYNEQSYWTVVGADANPVEALIGEDGAVELGNARCTIEPFVWKDGRLFTWADFAAQQSLQRGDLPIPSVTWGDLLRVTATVDGDATHSTLYVRYRVPEGARLYIAIRPFQVNTPWQFLSRTGGVVKIFRIAYENGRVSVEADQGVTIVASRPSSFGATTFDGGNIVGYLRKGKLPDAKEVKDPTGYASAAMQFDTTNVTLQIALNASGGQAPSPVRAPVLHDDWAHKLDRVRIEIPEKKIADSIRSNLAYILINRDGPAIQPGSRSYDRSWIRDGSLTSTALLRLGHYEEVRDFINWYSQFQYPDGKIPCCVGKAGADPVPEHDSHGQYIYLIAEYYRHTHDRPLVQSLWPRIEKTVAYIDSLRHQRMTKQYEGTPLYGLVPESISHEGYSAKAMHSYWDDFFILRGLKDATFLASELGKDATAYAAMREEFERNLLASIRLSMEQHHIDYIPGAAELGDFDATSTTIAIEPGGEQDKLPQAALHRTFDKYFEHALEPREYTPYEWRVVGTLVRLGEKDRALQLLRRFFLDQRPSGWNHWAEVVRPDPRKPGFIGDMPHTWVGSDFIRSALDLFAYENDDGTLVIGAAVDEAWLTAGVTVDGLSTHSGPLGYTMRRSGDEVTIDFSRVPSPSAVIIRSPLEKPIRAALVDGVAVNHGEHEVRLTKVPRHIVLQQ